jgi:hypothetical protein
MPWIPVGDEDSRFVAKLLEADGYINDDAVDGIMKA